MIGNDNEATLNTLIATTLDSADGYRQAAEKADNERYRSLFLEFAGERERCVRQLQDEVRQLGGNPEDDGSILAAAHRSFLSLRDAVTGSDDRSVVAEVERGEDHIKNKYEKALESGNLTGSAEQTVRQVYQSVREGHDRMSQLKHSLEGEHEAASTGMGGSSYEGTTGGSGSATGGFGSGTGSVGTGASGFGGSAGTTGANTPNTGYGSSPGGATGGGAMTGGSGNDRT